MKPDALKSFQMVKRRFGDIKLKTTLRFPACWFLWPVSLKSNTSVSDPAAESGCEDLKLSDGGEAACVGCLGLSLQQQMLGGAAVGVGRYRSFTSTPETPLPSLHHCCPPLHKEHYETHQQSALIHTSPVMSHFHQGLKK